jgi:hypothetical protein
LKSYRLWCFMSQPLLFLLVCSLFSASTAVRRAQHFALPVDKESSVRYNVFSVSLSQ